MRRRNAVVHNVWTLTRDGRIHGWRQAPIGKRDRPPPSDADTEVSPYGIAGRDWTEPALRSLFEALAHSQHRLARLRDESEWGPVSVGQQEEIAGGEGPQRSEDNEQPGVDDL